MKKITTSNIFLIVYTAISIATLYHSSFGFGTLDGLPNELSGWRLFRWWTLGFLCATSIDVGMGAIVWSMVKGYRSKFLMITLIILAIFSAYSQLIYSSYFAEDILAKTRNESLRPFMQWVLDIRIVLLPLCLPFFALFYGFVAKDSKESNNKIIEEDNVNRSNKKIMHYTDGKKITCGVVTDKAFFDNDINNVTCKNCLRILKQ